MSKKGSLKRDGSLPYGKASISSATGLNKDLINSIDSRKNSISKKKKRVSTTAGTARRDRKTRVSSGKPRNSAYKSKGSIGRVSDMVRSINSSRHSRQASINLGGGNLIGNLRPSFDHNKESDSEKLSSMGR